MPYSYQVICLHLCIVTYAAYHLKGCVYVSVGTAVEHKLIAELCFTSIKFKHRTKWKE